MVPYVLQSYLKLLVDIEAAGAEVVPSEALDKKNWGVNFLLFCQIGKLCIYQVFITQYCTRKKDERMLSLTLIFPSHFL